MDKKRNKLVVPSFFSELDLFKDFFDWDMEDYLKFDGNNSVSVYEDDNNVYVEASMPGVEADDIEITIDRGILWMKAESKEEKKDVKYHMKATKSYSYRVPVFSKIDEASHPDASYDAGILKVKFVKSKESKSKKIEVKKK